MEIYEEKTCKVVNRERGKIGRKRSLKITKIGRREGVRLVDGWIAVGGGDNPIAHNSPTGTWPVLQRSSTPTHSFPKLMSAPNHHSRLAYQHVYFPSFRNYITRFLHFPRQAFKLSRLYWYLTTSRGEK